MPALQAMPTPQRTPQMPQLFVSLPVSTQAVPQQACVPVHASPVPQ